MECGRELEAALRALLKKRHRQEYERVKDDPDLRFSDVKPLGGSRFSLRGIVKLENEDGNGIYRGVTIRFELRPGQEGKLSLHVLGFTELDLDEAILKVNRISKAARMVSALFIFAATISHSGIEAADHTGPFLVLPDTTSPDGHYAVAWGLPKHPEIWTEVLRWEREHRPSKEGAEEDSKQAENVFEKVDSVAEDVENYLVDLREGKIIHALPHGELPGYWIEVSSRTIISRPTFAQTAIASRSSGQRPVIWCW